MHFCTPSPSLVSSQARAARRPWSVACVLGAGLWSCGNFSGSVGDTDDPVPRLWSGPEPMPTQAPGDVPRADEDRDAGATSALPPTSAPGAGGPSPASDAAEVPAALDAGLVEPGPAAVSGLCGEAPGHVGLQRLTIPQLQNTLAELLGRDIEVPDAVVRDDRLGGYITLPDTQLASPTYIEQHLNWTLALTTRAVAEGALVSCDLADESCGLAETQSFLERAFRRPPTDDARDHFEAFYRAAAGDNAQKLATTLAAILNAPQFLFRERDVHNPDAPAPLSDYDVATRLAYFLWDGPPDDALLSAAASQALHDPSGVAAQVRRMLQSPRIEHLARAMASQWLELGRLWDHPLDEDRFPEYDPALKEAMFEESVRFLLRLVQEDRPVSELLTSHETFVNQRLAELYEVPGPVADGFELVSTGDSGPRFGLLGQAGPLALTSSGEVTSIIRRGKWVSTALLCTQIPPPPATLNTELVDTLPADATPREVVAAHRAAPECNVCHQHLDPPGLVLETFDPLGRVRSEYPPPVSQGIDTSTELADGTPVADVAEFVAVITQGEGFVRCLGDRLFPIAVGRLLGSREGGLVDAIAAGVPAADMRFSDLLVNLTTSAAFLCDAGEGTP